jgi:hypothetical protein
VAKITDAPADHWRHAEKIPGDILARLSRAELRARCAEMARLHQVAETAQAEHYRYLHARARQVARSLPVGEYIYRKRELAHRISGAGWELARVYREAARQLKEDNRYPDGLEGAVDEAFLGRPTTPETAEIAAHHAR